LPDRPFAERSRDAPRLVDRHHARPRVARTQESAAAAAVLQRVFDREILVVRQFDFRP
jgi:hypothetical protein